MGILQFFGAPSGAETTAANNESNTADYLGQIGAQNAAFQEAGFNEMNSVLNPIVAQGPSQMGFSPEYQAALETSAINSTAGNYANAERNAQTQLAGMGGSETAATNNVANQIKGSIAAQGANQLSNEQLGITEANWNQGLQNFNNAVGAKENLLGMENPTPDLSASMSGEEEAFNNQEKMQAQNAGALGSVIGLGTSLATGIPSIASSWTNMFNSGNSSGNNVPTNPMLIG